MRDFGETGCSVDDFSEIIKSLISPKSVLAASNGRRQANKTVVAFGYRSYDFAEIINNRSAKRVAVFSKG